VTEYLLTCREHGARGVRLYWTPGGWGLTPTFAIRYSEAQCTDLSHMTVLDPAWLPLDQLCREQSDIVDYDGACLSCGAAMGERGRCPC
jgi:hypothetical protein